MSTKAPMFAVVCGTLAFGCADLSNGADETQEIVDNLTQAGFPQSEISVSGGVVYVGNDAAVSLQASREMLQVDHSVSEEHYHTSNLVSSAVRTICIDPQPCNTFSSKFATALINAANNYTALALTFNMSVRANGDFTGCNARITCQLLSGVTGGSAGFPLGGLPCPTISIGTGLDASTFTVDNVEAYMTHELGHCIGVRHTDWFDRSISCGSGGSEGTAGVGAILIPGTPTGGTSGGSIFNACLSGPPFETGEFTSLDITALNVLY